MRRKLEKVRKLGYIAPGPVKSLTSFFSMPKGYSDISMVYDGTKSGLNGAMWAPWFALPTLEGHLYFVESGSFMGDIDIGDMFLNFILHENVHLVVGVDVTPFFSSGNRPQPRPQGHLGEMESVWDGLQKLTQVKFISQEGHGS